MFSENTLNNNRKQSGMRHVRFVVSFCCLRTDIRFRVSISLTFQADRVSARLK